MSDIITSAMSLNLTSDTEFDFVKRVQITNEVPPTSPWALMPAGLRSDFWKYFLGTVETAQDLPSTAEGVDPLINAVKIVNGVVADNYGPLDGSDYHSINIDGVILPEFDLFLHEVYRYLDHVYPDHPDYIHLLTTNELNDAFYAAAAIIGYTPNYQFLEKWSASFTGTSLTREELKWKIRDLRVAAFRRKFAGSYIGYKSVFSSIMRHGSVYLTGTYLPKVGAKLDVTNSNLFRRFRLIDFLGEATESYQEAASIAFNGIVDPSNPLYVYEADAQSLINDVSELPRVLTGAFISDTDQVLAPAEIGQESGYTVQSVDSAAAGYPTYVVHYFQVSNTLNVTTRKYTNIRSGVETDIVLTPRVFGNPDNISENTQGQFSLPVETAVPMYPSTTAPLTPVSSITFGQDIIHIGDAIQDTYQVGATVYHDTAQVTGATAGTVILVTDPVRSAPLQSVPSQTVLNTALNIHVPNIASDRSVSYTDVFIEGVISYTINQINRPTQATFMIKNIPEVNPITGLSGNRAALLKESGEGYSSSTLRIGQSVDTYIYDEDSSTWVMSTAVYSWLSEIDFGYISTMEIENTNVDIDPPILYSAETFKNWKLRASSEFSASLTVPDTETIYGAVSETSPRQLNILGSTAERSKLDGLSVGDIIHGPGISEGTVISAISADYLLLSLDAVRFGSFQYTLSLKRGYAVKTSRILSFKNKLYSRYPTLSTSVFSFLWPASPWPLISSGYMEGIKDAALYTYPAERLPTVSASNIYFEKDIYLDLSLDRLLYHQNTLNRKTGSQYLCICDTPWLDYVETAIQRSKRASEQVHIGAQINLSTDISGLYSVSAGQMYTDSNIRTRFIVLPQSYTLNSTPSYIQLGTGGASKSGLFVSIDNLLRPDVWGGIVYDRPREVTTAEKRRSVYLNSTGATSLAAPTDSGDTTETVTADLESPIFETPVGEYEDLVNFSDPHVPTNDYHVIHAIVESQKFNNIPTVLTGDDAPIINSPAFIELKKLPDADWHYRGNWVPATVPHDPVTPLWPAPGDLVSNDYYVVTQTTVIGTLSVTKDDWIVWTGSSWNVRTWTVQGILTGGTMTLPVLPDAITIPVGQTLADILQTQFPYFIFTSSGTVTNLNGGVTVSKGDWLILTSAVGNVGTWYVADGQCYDTLSTSIARNEVETALYNTITQNVVSAASSTITTYQLPRRFLARGSCKFRIRLNPEYTAVDMAGNPYNLTENPMYYDPATELFYVKNTSDSGDVVKHYVKFREPKYFKTLGVFTGTVTSTNPTVMTSIPGVTSPLAKLSLKDPAISGLQVQVRNTFNATYESKYFNHYVAVSGMPNPADRHILNPVVTGDADLDAIYAAEFQAAWDKLHTTDVVHGAVSVTSRVYSSSYENKYYKNLLAVAGTVEKSNPTVLRSIGTGSDDIRAFSDALGLLAADDRVVASYSLGGFSYYASKSVPISSVNTAACDQKDSPTWMIGGANGGLARSTNTTDWTTLSISGWGSNAINKIIVVVLPSGITEWRIVGDGGKCAYSVDGGNLWTTDPLAGSGWGSTNILDIDYDLTTNTWVIVGEGGKAAYFVDAVGSFWTLMTLPLPGTIPVPVDPPGAPGGSTGVNVGWGTEPVRTVAVGNGVWMIGGGSNTTNVNEISLLARSTNLSQATPFTLTYLGELWGNNQVNSIAYGANTWIAVGSGGAVSYSTNDGLSWASVAMPESWGVANITSISWDYGVWTITGDGGLVATSSDGLTWEVVGTTALASTNLYTSAHGIAASGTIEHIIAGNSNTIAYSNSTSQSMTTTRVRSVNANRLEVEFNTALVTWDPSDQTTRKTLLLTINTAKSIACELIGIPTARIPAFVYNSILIIPSMIQVSSASSANRVFYPHLNPGFDLVPHVGGLTSEQIRELAGYPLYEEDDTAYYKTAAGLPLTYTNYAQDTIYFCDSAGNYVTALYEPISVLDFVKFESSTDGELITQFIDPREPSYTPKYGTYKEWIQFEGAFANTNNVVFVGAITSLGTDIIRFDTAIPTLTDENNIVRFTIMPSVASTGTQVLEETPAYATSPAVDLPITGMYFPAGGYGTWMNYSGSDTPWVTDPASFIAPSSTFLVNSLGKPVYLCDSDGSFRLAAGLRIPVPAPLYLTFRELLTTAGRIIEKSALAEITTDIYVTGTNTTTGTIILSKAPCTFGVGETEKQVQIRILTLASFTPPTKVDARDIYSIAQTELTKYTPDRVYTVSSAYPSVSDSPELYENGNFVNTNGFPVYGCDISGNYIDGTGTVTTTNFVQGKLPKYLLCQDWYKNTAWVEGQEDNPYWQYIVVEDSLSEKTKTWSQSAYMAYMLKSAFGSGMVVTKIIDDSNYVTIYPGFTYQIGANNFQITPAEYIQYKDGKLIMNLISNPVYDAPSVNFEKYGISYSNAFPTGIFSDVDVVHETFPGKLFASYYVNTTQNFANRGDTKGSVVAITEMGVFNTANNLIAYATFPPVIYDSSKHHLSLNLFIKESEFTVS